MSLSREFFLGICPVQHILGSLRVLDTLELEKAGLRVEDVLAALVAQVPAPVFSVSKAGGALSFGIGK